MQNICVFMKIISAVKYVEIVNPNLLIADTVCQQQQLYAKRRLSKVLKVCSCCSTSKASVLVMISQVPGGLLEV